MRAWDRNGTLMDMVRPEVHPNIPVHHNLQVILSEGNKVSEARPQHEGAHGQERDAPGPGELRRCRKLRRLARYIVGPATANSARPEEHADDDGCSDVANDVPVGRQGRPETGLHRICVPTHSPAHARVLFEV